MSTAQPANAAQVSVLINAEPETVWRFLSEQDKLLAWMTFIPGSPIPPGSCFEPRPGGKLRIVFPNGGEARGEVLELQPRKKLVFTWGYEPDVAKTGLGPGACRVEVTMLAIDGGTRVTLTHSGPMSQQIAREHEAGWRHYLSLLAAHSAQAQFEPALPELVRTYLTAWNEPDAAKRRSLLESCCDAAIAVRTTFACTNGLYELDRHIANAQRSMPGVSLVSDEPPQHQHGFARFGWTARGPGGQPFFAGQNFARLAAREGGVRILELVGFMSPPSGK